MCFLIGWRGVASLSAKEWMRAKSHELSSSERMQGLALVRKNGEVRCVAQTCQADRIGNDMVDGTERESESRRRGEGGVIPPGVGGLTEHASGPGEGELFHHAGSWCQDLSGQPPGLYNSATLVDGWPVASRLVGQQTISTETPSGRLQLPETPSPGAWEPMLRQ